MIFLETLIAQIYRIADSLALSGYEVQGAISIPCPLYARLGEASESLNFRYRSLFFRPSPLHSNYSITKMKLHYGQIYFMNPYQVRWRNEDQNQIEVLREQFMIHVCPIFKFWKVHKSKIWGWNLNVLWILRMDAREWILIDVEHTSWRFAFLSSQWHVEEGKRVDREDKGRHSAANRHWGWKSSIGGASTSRGDADSSSQLPWDLPRRKSRSGSRTGAPRTKELKRRS